MAKVATAGPLPPSDALHFGGGGGGGVGGGSKVTTTTLKRKTPSELRGELLKRKNVMEIVDESPAPVIGSMGITNGVSGPKRSDPSKNPRYIDTRMDELFPVRKNSIRLKLLSKKDHAKDEHMGNLNMSSAPSPLAAESQIRGSCPDDSLASTSAAKDHTAEPCNKTGKCSNNSFRSVTELSQSGEQLSGLSNVDMDKALRGLVAREPLVIPPSLGQSFGGNHHLKPSNFCSEFHIPGKKAPLDLTLKTSMRVISSSSVSWFHRLVNCGNAHFTSWGGCSGGRDTSHSSGPTSSTKILNQKMLHSWVYPESPLPTSVISALSLATGEGGQMDFLSKRHQTWEDSFRSLYYMLRKNICNIFYVRTAQFVVMFTGSDGLNGRKRSCNAYISQSTRGLRSLLKEHDVCFSMPLCQSKVEEATAEDLVELSEIEKQNLGQTRNIVSMSDVDNSPESLLVFSGSQNVHGLYDFLLNYRYLLTSLTGADVPLLYSPVPFDNAALSAPEVRCKELRKADHMSLSLKEPNVTAESNRGSSPGICYSVEIKDAYLPPWIICGVCDAIGSDETSFEASFVTEPTSIALNVGLGVLHQNSDSQAAADEALQKSCHLFGIADATFSPHIRSVFVKGLKYSCGSYTASVSPV